MGRTGPTHLYAATCLSGRLARIFREACRNRDEPGLCRQIDGLD